MICYPIVVPELTEFVRYIVFCIVLTVCNSFVLCIWLKPENRSTITKWLVLIAIFDSLSMLCATFNAVSEYTQQYWKGTTLCIVSVVSVSLSDTFHSISLLVAMAMAMQRFVVCAFPLKGRKMCNSRIQTLLLIAGFILPIICLNKNLCQLSTNIHSFSSHNLEDNAPNNRNITKDDLTCKEHGAILSDLFLEDSEFNHSNPSDTTNTVLLGLDCGSNETDFCQDQRVKPTQIRPEITMCIGKSIFSESVINVMKLCDLIIIHILPSLVITVCMMYCLRTIRKVKMRKYKITKEDLFKSHKKKIILVILVILSILSGEIPNIVYQSLEYVYGAPRDDIWLLTRTGRTFCDLFTAMSFLHNVWIYTAMSKPFRQSFYDMVRCRQTRRETNRKGNSTQ